MCPWGIHSKEKAWVQAIKQQTVETSGDWADQNPLPARQGLPTSMDQSGLVPGEAR